MAHVLIGEPVATSPGHALDLHRPAGLRPACRFFHRGRPIAGQGVPARPRPLRISQCAKALAMACGLL